MPVITDVPNAEGSVKQWSLGAGASIVSAVGIDDDDVSTILANGSGSNHRFLMPSLPGDAVSPVNSGSTGAKMRLSGAGSSYTAYVHYNGSNFPTPGQSNKAAFLEFSHAFSGGELVVATINAAEYGCAMSDNSGAFVYCSYIRRTVDYSIAAPAAFARSQGIGFFFSWLLPLLGAGVTYQVFSDALLFISRVGGTIPGRSLKWAESEIEAMFSNWQAWGRRVYA